jgi:hypothetical protein
MFLVTVTLKLNNKIAIASRSVYRDSWCIDGTSRIPGPDNTVVQQIQVHTRRSPFRLFRGSSQMCHQNAKLPDTIGEQWRPKERKRES